jgi:CRISPR-associated protein Csx10
VLRVSDTGTLTVSVTAKQRLALGVGSEVSYFTGSHLFVPGSVLRGALAAAWIAEHGPPVAGSSNGARFRDLFDGRIRYGPLHVPGSTLVPLSVRLCKYPKNEACTRQPADAAFGATGDCPACGGPMEPGKGQVTLPPGVAQDRITRTSIDPKTATAKDGELYAHGALPAATQLSGFIHGRDPWLEASRKLRLGGRRTVGGAVEYTAMPGAPDRDAAPWNGTGPLVIRLSSPGIFVDAAGRPSLAPDPDLDLDGAKVARAWARPVTWSGWHAASGLPKPEELCAVPGSTYQLDGPPPLLRGLAERLARDGAGLRRIEGFGAIQVAVRPWQPPPPPPESGIRADAEVLQVCADIRSLNFDPDQRRWIIDALRDLQLDRERRHAGQAGAAQPAGRLAEELLARPAADNFSGPQRDALRTLFTETHPGLLRDVAVLLGADRSGESGGGADR